VFAIIYICKRGLLRMQKTIATRVSRELEEEIIRFMEEEGLDKPAAIKRILEIRMEEKKSCGVV